MGGSKSAPAASSAGGYSNPAAMARATIGGTTGSNVSGMGWVPKAQASSSFWKPTQQQMSAFGDTLSDATRQFEKTFANQRFAAPMAPDAGMFSPQSAPSPFAGLAVAMPRVSSSRIASAAQNLGPAGSMTTGFRI